MIERYTLPEMGELWTDEYKFKTWLQVEIAVCEAQAELGRIPQAAVDEIKAKAKFDVARILEIEAEVRHDVIAFLTNVNEYVGDAGRYIHLGMTSSDVLDTALSLQIVASHHVILSHVEKLIQAIRNKAQEHRNTVMIGRSHGIHAEPMTFGFKLAGWLAEVLRHRERLCRIQDEISVGQISGAVCNYANIDPEIEALTCQKLGLKPDTASTQVISRDVHAEFMTTLAGLAASIERFAVEIRNLQRTDVLEVEELFAKGQKGSSAMPHKRNPIIGERLSGLARVLRGNAIAGMENVALWHERDISHSSVERVVLPDSTGLLDYMLVKLADMVDKQMVYPKNMQKNLDLTKGLYFSQSVLLELTDRGLPRREAYELVQKNAMACWNGDEGSFLDYLLKDQELKERISPNDLKEICSLDRHFRYIDQTFKKCGLSK
ncbi:MAG: adenylosuccinate lyase [Verrucomicrobiota bacterium]